MRVWWRIVPVWACFLARGVFYSSSLPLWEGYDEWAHFAVVRTMALRGEWLVARDQPAGRDVEESLALAPVPWELRSLPAPAVTEDVYWSLPAEERGARESRLRAMPIAWSREDAAGGFQAYEALQPPLYYWLMVPLLGVLRGAGLLAQVMALRWAGVAIASLTIPLVFAIGREVLGDDRVAAGCAAVVALMPGFAIDVARVGNDSLAVVLFSAVIWAGLRTTQVGMSATLGLGLLTKAYLLTALPVAALRKRGWIAAGISILIAGWWYVRNVVTTGTISGLSESVMLRGLGAGGMIRKIPSVPWRTAVDAILLSHLYFGGWSSLTVRSWMYHVFYAVAIVAAAGLLLQLGRAPVRWLAAIYAAFWIGQFYNVLLLYLSKGLAGSMGWYMYAVVAAEVVLSVAGFGRFGRWAAAGGAALFGLFDLYTMHAVAIPYYTGMIRHKANGALAAVHMSDFRAAGFGGVFERLAINKPALISRPVLIALWAAYLLATAALIAWSGRNARTTTPKQRKPEPAPADSFPGEGPRPSISASTGTASSGPTGDIPR